MNKDIVKGKWNEMFGAVKEKWGKLTDSEITQIGGRLKNLSGILQKKYGYKLDEAEREVKNFIKDFENKNH